MTSITASELPADRPASPRRRRGLIRWAGPVLLLLGLGAAASVWWSFYALRVQQTYRLVETSGAVRLVAGAQRSGEGDRAAEGATVITESDGFASIELTDGTTVRLSPGSTLTFEEALRTPQGDRSALGLRLGAGEATTAVPRGDGVTRAVKLSTDVVAIGVRGTVFTTSAAADASRVTVTKGAVEAAGESGEPVKIPAGFGTVVRPGKAAETPTELLAAPRPLAPAQRQQVASLALEWTRDDAATAWDLQFDDASTFASPVRQDRLSAANEAIEPLAQDGVYFWRVAAVDGRGLRGAWSEPQSFEQTTHFEEGRRALLELDVDAALKAFGATDRAYDGVVEQLMAQAREHAADGQLDLARREFELVHQLRPEDLDVVAELGELEASVREFSGARRRFDEVVERDPENLRATLGLARLDYEEAHFDDSLRRVSKALGREPRNVAALELAAINAVNVGNLEAANRHVEALMAIDPRNPNARALRETLERREEAATLFQSLGAGLGVSSSD